MKALYILVIVGVILASAVFYISQAQGTEPVPALQNVSAPGPLRPQTSQKNTTTASATAETSNSSGNLSATMAPDDSPIRDTISIPVSEITSSARFYTFDANGVTVRYFVVIGSDGKVRAAFDACKVCYRAHKGYTQVGNYMKCNNCGQTFSIDELGTANTEPGCWPSFLANEVKGDKIIIKTMELEANVYIFR